MDSKDPAFLADVMLGRLAKWLRILGYDTEYLASTCAGPIPQSLLEGRILLSRKRDTVGHYEGSFLIHSEKLEEQLEELRERYGLRPDRSTWFTRCLSCNVALRKATPEDARESVPEYVLYENIQDIRYCPSCYRYYWPGTHRKKMFSQLEALGF